MEQQTLSRLQKTSGIIAAVFKIAAIVIILYGSLFLAALIAYRVSLGGFTLGSTDFHFSEGEAGSVGIIGGADGPTQIFTTGRLAIPFLGTLNLSPWLQSLIMVLQFAQLALLVAALFTASSVFGAIKRSHTPFLPEVPRRMKRIAILMLIVGLMGFGVQESLSMGLMPMSQPITLLAAGLCYCFAFIFDYGFRLQKQDDETL